MNPPYDILTTIRQTIKFYESLLKEVCREHGLTQLEVNIISFLHNNPGRDTAADIVELRMLPKGNVSQGVEALIQKSLLQRQQDADDRRRIHLTLTPKALPAVKKIETCKDEFYCRLFAGFSLEERDTYIRLHQRIVENTSRGLEEHNHHA